MVPRTPGVVSYPGALVLEPVGLTANRLVDLSELRMVACLRWP